MGLRSTVCTSWARQGPPPRSSPLWMITRLRSQPSALIRRATSAAVRSRRYSPKIVRTFSASSGDHHQPHLVPIAAVAQGRARAEPLSPLAGRAHLVAGAVGDHLPLELRERQEDVQRQPPHRVLGVELLGRRDEADLVRIEQGEQPGEVEQRPAEAIDLVDHHAVDLAGLDVVEQLLERGALDARAAEAAVVVSLGQDLPALVPHRLDVVLRRLALGVEGVEVGVEPLAGRLAGVDRAAHPAGLPGRLGLGGASAHSASSVVLEDVRFLRVVRPAHRKPFQVVPVITRAMVDRLV